MSSVCVQEPNVIYTTRTQCHLHIMNSVPFTHHKLNAASKSSFVLVQEHKDMYSLLHLKCHFFLEQWSYFFEQFSSDKSHIGWRRLIGCLKSQVIFHKRATNYGALLGEMTYKDKASYDSAPPCIRHPITNTLHNAATHCTTLHHAAQHCNTLHHTAPHCTTLQHVIYRALFMGLFS